MPHAYQDGTTGVFHRAGATRGIKESLSCKCHSYKSPISSLSKRRFSKMSQTRKKITHALVHSTKWSFLCKNSASANTVYVQNMLPLLVFY